MSRSKGCVVNANGFDSVVSGGGGSAAADVVEKSIFIVLGV